MYVQSCPGGDFEAVVCDQTSFIYTVEESKDYYIRIGNSDGDTGFGKLTISVIPNEEQCPGDCDEDGQRNVNDLLTLLADFGNASDCDISGDGIISVDDILDLISNFNVPCE